ncbi:YtpR family tRNA-binding protein [Amphibacillus sp. Q70]|uniref:YtpR family tRNA-binding protein n=1 Tax=Amphibacillus sp. Q70 TaxID=3453416 RepID=UPI003F8774BB
MDVFYNKEGIGDVLIIPLKQGNRETTGFNKYGDVAEIYDNETNQVTGYNIFNSSTYLELADGKHELTESLLASINEAFTVNGVPEALSVDLSPKFVIGYVKAKEKHENADKLSVCQVDLGDETVQIVCGAPNVATGQHVVVAKVGAIMPSGMEIKEANLRGVDSFGMICSQKELGLPNAPEEKGIYVLTDNVEAGQSFNF